MAVVLLAVTAALAVPAASSAKKSSAQRIHGVKVDDTGLPLWLTDQLGASERDGEVGRFTFPATLDSVVRLEQPNGWIGFQLQAAPRKVKREAYRNGVVYRTGRFDVVQHVTAKQRMREAIVVRKHLGVRTWRWRLVKSGSGDAPTLTAQGQVSLGANGYIDVPAIHRFDGSEVEQLRWKLRGNVLSLRVDDRKLQLPYVLDPPLGADTTPPVVTFDGFVENTPAYTFVNATGNTLYYNPAQAPGSFTMRFRATDAQSLISYVRFPDLGTGWSPGGDDTTGFSGASATPNSGTGLNGSYQNYTAPCAGLGSPASAAFNGVGFTRVDGPINFDWANSAPAGATGIAADCFTVRWMGYFEAPTTGNYWFRTRSDDGARLWVDGYLANDFWTEHAVQYACGGQVHGRRNTTTTVANPAGIPLTAGQRVPIVLDFNENAGQAVIGLQYRTNAYTNDTSTTTGCNAAWTSGGWTVAPASRLYTAESYEWTYDWAATNPQVPPTTLGVVARDAAGNDSTPKAFSVIPDTGQPTGGSLTYNAYTGNNTTVSITGLVVGTDALTGVPDWYLERTSSPLVGGACTGPWSTWSILATNPAAGATSLPGQPAGQCHQYRLRVLDGVGNEALYTDPDIVRLDTVGPSFASGVLDGPTVGTDIQWINSGTSISGNWGAPSDTHGTVALPLRWCIGTAATPTGCGGTSILAYTAIGGATNATQTPVAFTQGTTYYVCVRALDNAGNQSDICSDGARYDSIAPAAPTVRDGATAPTDIAWQASTTTINANWANGTEAVSGIAVNESCVTTSPTGADCAAGALATWTAQGTATTATHTGLTLALGTTYYVCVRSRDNAGNQGPSACSNGVQVDSIPPLPPAPVLDIVSPSLLDQTWTTSTTTLASSWPVATDPSGIQRYDICYSTSSTGADCAAAAVLPFTSTALVTSHTTSALTLASGTTYYSCVRAVDGLGNVGVAGCSNGITVDTVAPSAPTTVNDGPAADVTWTTSAANSTANWSGATDATSGVGSYRYCVKGMAGGADCTSGTIYSGPTTVAGTSATVAAGVPAGTQHRFCVAAIDNAGNIGTYTCSNGQTADTSIPSVPAAVADSLAADIDLQSSTTTLSGNWGASTDTFSGLARYEYCLTSTAGGANCAGAAMVPWTANGTTTNVTRSGLSLVNATTYFVCVRSVDNAGNVSLHACSDGVTVDAGPPTWPGGSTVDDGPGPGDITWTTSASVLANTWSAATDPSGIDHYEFCISTVTSCGGAPIVNWTSTGTTRSQSSTGLSLTQGTTYYTCVRGYDAALNVGPLLCSNGQTVDSVAPVLPAAVSDGTAADIAWVRSLTTASANWPGGSDATSGIANWSYCISTGTACSGTIVRNWTATGTATTVTSSGLSLVEGQLYYVCVRGTDVAGNATAGSACSNGQRVDTVAPPAPSPINDGTAADIAFQASATQVDANWTGVADPTPGVGVASGLQQYRYCVSTSSSGADCAGAATVPWTVPGTPTATSISATGLSLTNGSTYYVCVQSWDIAGNTSTTGCSNGVVIDTGPPSASWTSWTVTHADPANPHLYSPGGNLLWYNPTIPAGQGGTARATVTATDPGAGMNRVVFPSLGAAGWGPGGTDSTVGAGNTWTWDYTVASGAIGDPALNNATAYDNGGAFTGSPALDFTIQPDAAGPVVGSMAPMTGLQNTVLYPQGPIPLGNDTDSGIDRWVMDVQFAPLYDGACGPWDPWTDGTTIPGYSGTASNGTNLSITHHLNDPDLNGVADYHDSACFRTQVHVFDHVGNETIIPANGFMRFDFGTPSVAVTGPANLSPVGATAAITGTTSDVWPGGGMEYPNTGSGIDHVTVTYQHQSLPAVNGTACASVVPVGAWTAHTWTCNWNTVATGNDGWYDVTTRSYDRAGNVSASVTRSYLVDNNAPVVSWHSWDDHSDPSMHAVGNVAWVNPNASPGSYTLDARVTAQDLGSLVSAVNFPALGAGWSPGVLTAATNTSPNPVANAYTLSYTYANPGTLAAPGVQAASAVDGAGNAAPIGFEVRLDGTAPTGMSAAVANGLQTSPNVVVTIGSGSDGALESGIGSWTLRYDRAPLVNNACGAYTGTWSIAASGFGIAPASRTHDVTALGTGCYKYVVQVSDNVGNVGTSTSATQQKVDLDLPTVAITSPTTGSAQSGTFAVSGTATDVGSGMNKVRITWAGPSSTSGTICDPATLGGASPNWTFTCSWNTSALPDGTYTVTATSFDNAGNASTPSVITLLLDNQPPFIGFHSFNETSPYTYWAGPIGTNNLLWYNPNAPAGSYSFDVRVDASDPSGVSRVEFAGAGAGWTPSAAVATQTVPIGPATRYSQTYSFDTSGAVADPPTLNVQAFDPANNPGTTTFELAPDTADPAAGTISYANGYVGSTSVVVTLATGGDGAGSGIAGWDLQRSDGTLSGGACISWGGYASVATGAGTFTGTRTDTVTDPGCFRYQLVVTDNVGRTGTFGSASQVKVDLVPPTGSLVMSEATNPQFQYLASPTKLFVNTSAAGSGSFNVDVTASAASGVLDVDFPTLASGFTGNGVVPGPGPNFPHVYTWTGPASTPPATSNVRVRSNSLGFVDLPFEVVADSTAPTSSAPTHTSGFTTSTSVAVTWTGGADGTGSGVAGDQLQRDTGTLAGGTCTWANAWTNVAGATTPGTVNDASLATATCYRYRTASTDNVGNVGYSAASTPIMVDTTAPIGASVVITETTNVGRQHVSAPDTIWVAADPGGPASFTVTVTANDPESGTGTAVFPALGSTFVPTTVGPFVSSYAWSATAVAPGATPSVLVANGAGLTTTIPFNVYVDGNAPTGATIDQENGFITDFQVTTSYATGSEAGESGVATWRLERDRAAYDILTDTCSPWTGYATYPLPTGQPASPYTDVAVSQPNCYRYRLYEVDRVGNVRLTSDGDIAKVITDVFPPAAFNLNLPTNPALPAITTGQPAPSCETVPTYTSAIPGFSWTASSDAESGLAGYDVFLDGVGAPTANVPAPGTGWVAPGPLSDGAHTIGVRALDNLANFRNAGPAFPTSFRIDTAAPTGSLAAPTNGSWTSDTTPTLDWNASDSNCLARIDVAIDGSLVGVASGTEGSWTPAAPLASGMHTWWFTPRDSLNTPTTYGPFTFGIDTTPPSASAITAPTGGTTVRGFVNVTWSAATDSDSGMPAAGAYQVLVDGTVRSTTGSGTTSATISGITNGLHTIVVRSIDAVGNTTDSAPVAFTGYPTIPAPVLVSPANGSYRNSVPTLSWSWPSDGGPAPTDFDVYVDGVLQSNVAWPTTSLAIADPGDGTHSWYVEQHDPYTGTRTSATWNVTLDRTLPLNPGPLTRVATVVSWPVPTDPAAPVASGIAKQEFWIDDGTTQSFAVKTSGATSHNYGTLPDGIYTMWVRAYDNAGNTTDSAPLVVTNDSVPPTAFNLTPPPALPALPAITHGAMATPSCESDPTYVTGTPTLQWTASSDATSGLAGYDVYVDGSLVTTTGAGATSYTLATALPGGTHTWHVVAKDNFGLTRLSSPGVMNVRVDAAPPTITYGAPADNSYTSDTTPTFNWTASDDSCIARVELTVGANTYVLTGAASSFTPTVVLPEGPTTWSLRAFDSAGNVVSAGPARTVNVDTTAPTAVTAIFPTNAGTAPEQMMTFQWSAGSDGTGSGVARYDLIVDGTQVASNVVATTKGTYAIYAGAHTWAVRAYDAVGNSALFNFSFTATPVPDVTPPDPFNLLTPADGSSVPAGTPLTWEPAWDFKGVAQYRVYIDGALVGTTAGNVTTFTPAAGSGTPICTVDFDPGTSAGCLSSLLYSWGSGATTTAQNQVTSPNFNVASYAGWTSSGGAIGVGNPTVTPITSAAAGFDGDRKWTAVQYQTTIPATGADLRFEHRYRFHAVGQSAYDGGTVELRVDTAGDGFTNDTWGSTCEFNAKQIYGTTLDCKYPIVELNGGYNAVMGGANKSAHPLAGQHSFSGDSGGMVQTKLKMTEFAGKNVQVRFRIGTDSCYVGMTASAKMLCDIGGATNVQPALWRIDNVELANPALAPGAHTWYVVARDAAGNQRQSGQTWSFILP